MMNFDKTKNFCKVAFKEYIKLINRISYLIILPVYLVIFIFWIKDIKELLSIWWELFKKGEVYDEY